MHSCLLSLGIPIDEIKRMHPRQIIYQILNLLMVVSTAFMIWKSLMLATGSDSPVVVVLSGSMEPAFHRGDLLLLTYDRSAPIKAGEVVVFKLNQRDIPIVHRAIKVHGHKDDMRILTKGDNNEVDDRGLYPKGQLWLRKKDIIGKTAGCLPYVGMVTIIMNDYPQLKYMVLLILAAYVLTNREQ
ncbi:hypothetical protein ACOME3_001654 [Neoechinorhynchus agilis]